ncbi:hypothetical protein BJX99DRAFT_264856 [Aspergillus californicus]
MPHGQPPIPPPRRQQDVPYASGPPNMRSPPAYMGFPPQMNGHPSPAVYPPQQYGAQWYGPYPPMQMPPRQYPNPYAPAFISSYPPSQPLMAPSHMPPQSLPLQPRASTPYQIPMSPSVAALPPIPPQPHSPIFIPVQSTPSPAISSSPAPPVPVNIASSPAEPFRPPLPWLSVPNSSFPARAPRRPRNSQMLQASLLSVELPAKDLQRTRVSGKPADPKPQQIAQTPSEPQTPTLSAAPSIADSTQPTTPSSTVHSSTPRPQSQPKGAKATIPVVPVVPVIPAPSTPRQEIKDNTGRSSETSKSTTADKTGGAPSEAAAAQGSNEPVESEQEPAKPAPVAPKSWADLVRNKNLARGAVSSGSTSELVNGVVKHQSQSVADVILNLGDDVSQYSDKVAFLEPRGLVNTGNMCYMNSVLQILVSCVPFYQLLDHIGKRASHSFQSNSPMIDALIMFMKEFRIIDAAHDEDQLRMRLKATELEEYGEAFVPEFVYEVIRQLPRFRDMRRGHQQDAQEFLGFLLEEMHEECARITKSTPARDDETSTATNGENADGWLEVGHKQKPAVTRSSGHIASESPITKIFGGKIRSEFRVPGNKTSVTLEPYQPLQLDIGAPDVHNIIDALKGLTKSESIQGDFNSTRGPNVTATKQVFIENLPPVLILHLKRFQYDSVTHGTQKIWKKVGYPLDLEIPREVFPSHRRNMMMAQGGLPKYRLIGVIYHHGKNASGGHYTVDVRRQEGREWIRLDDTVIRRIKSEDVAEAGGEEDPKVLAAALEQHKRDKDPTNIYDHIEQGDHSDDDRGWSQVNGTGSSGHSSKKSGSAINGTPSQSGANSGVRTPLGRYGTRDNKVAYLLFYERIP